MTYHSGGKLFGQSTANENRSYQNTVLAGATGASTVSGSAVLFPESATTAVSITVKPHYMYRIATRENPVMYSFGHSTWTKAGHKSAYLPADSWVDEWCPQGLTTLSFTLCSGNTTGTDVHVTEKLSVDLPQNGLLPDSIKLIGQ